MRTWLCVTAAALTACGESTGTDPLPTPGEIDVVTVATGLDRPLLLVQPAGDARQFIVEQGGRILIRSGGLVSPTPFLDIGNQIASGGERGLLGVAFHPQFAANGFFFASYTDPQGDSRIVRFTAQGDVADPNSALLILTVSQPFSNHNGGMIAFGGDGLLYIGLGDGGGAGDTQGNAQNRSNLLGSMLRIDVDNPDAGSNYGVPGDNPFVGTPNVRGEIWHYGLRNPWRWSFDPVDDLLYIADVGQNEFEEITVVPASASGLNYGWNVMEGLSCFNAGSCDQTGLTLPAVVFDHSNGACSITGGFVYRGDLLPGLRGHYFYSDFCAGFLRSFRVNGSAVADETDWQVNLGSVMSFGQDADGELYVLTADGRVLQLVPAS